MSKLLPLFPLQLVVFPRTQLPLHIFEERYKEMINLSISNSSEFGIVMARQDGIANIGCTVAVEKVITRYEDGRMDILTAGVRRFEIVFLDQEKDYLRGQVTFFEDDAPEAVPAALREEALAHYHGLLDTREVRGYGDPDLDDPQLSFQLAQAVSDLEFQNKLLRSRSEIERLEMLNRFLSHYVVKLQQTTRMKHLAPLNGSGAKPAGL